KKQLKSKGIRVNVDKSEEKMGYKIRNAQVKKVPYTIVIGDDEVSNNTLSVRKHGGNSEQIFELSNFIEKVIKEINIL
ncbi:His/Gly/Thr/Pro-type tRNA ligase C-terminal domain-containing protein, partial [Staphylococcus shinii]|nr:His/Gly/Thr/Pro-type tRNA ligase C-terminal domain-containing protein [Staphylococcus shinii]